MKTIDLLRFFRFGVVGSLGFVIDFGITYLLKEGFGVWPFLANTAGFSMAVVNNYLLNKYWTFSEKSEFSARQFIGFLVISLIGLLINTALLALFFQALGLNFYLAKVIATGMVMCWNFLANRIWVFKSPPITLGAK